MDHTQTAKQLNDLLEYLHDSRDGYKESAGETTNQKLKTLFEGLVRLRQDMISSLTAEVTQLGEKPKQQGSMTAAAHRLFLDLKSLLTGHDNEAIINEIKRGESFTMERYREVIQADIDSKLKDLLSQQLKTIESNLLTIDVQSITTL